MVQPQQNITIATTALKDSLTTAISSLLHAHRAGALKHKVAIMLERHAGWLNVLGQFATTGTLGYITVKHLGVMWMLANGHIFSNAETFLAYASELHNHIFALQDKSCLHHQRGLPTLQMHTAQQEGQYMYKQTRSSDRLV